jgi:hypothetical protein
LKQTWKSAVRQQALQLADGAAAELRDISYECPKKGLGAAA